MCGASKTAGREKRSRGLGDDGGGWKSSKRVEVARALVLDRKRSSFLTQAVKEESVFCLGPALSCISAVLSPILSNRWKIIFFQIKQVLNTVVCCWFFLC